MWANTANGTAVILHHVFCQEQLGNTSLRDDKAQITILLLRTALPLLLRAVLATPPRHQQQHGGHQQHHGQLQEEAHHVGLGDVHVANDAVCGGTGEVTIEGCIPARLLAKQRQAIPNYIP